MRLHERSRDLYERACGVLAGGVSSEFRKFSTPHPLFYERAKGTRVWDVDGNEYLDFALSQGPLILGHGHPHVLETVNRASASGQLFGGQHLMELELAERLQQLIPCADLLRFSLSGSEAVHAALRLARAATGRPKFIRFEGQYHGWFDNVAFGVGGSLEELGDREAPTAVPWTGGLPAHAFDEAMVLPWNDLTLLEATLADAHESIAAVITEPVMCNSGCIWPTDGFLEGLRRLCDRYGVLLIFDEVITGFRLGMEGAQGHFGVIPDLAVFGKALGSGYPLSVLAGRRQVMGLLASGEVIHAGTMNSNGPTIAATSATLDVLEADGTHEHIWKLGRRLAAGLREVAADSGHALAVSGPGPMIHVGFVDPDRRGDDIHDYRGTLGYDRAKYAGFVEGMHNRGIRLIGRGLWYLCGAHTVEEIDEAVATAGEVLQTIDA